MERKSDMVRRLVGEGKTKEALRIAKDFRLGITKEQSDSMKYAYECIVHGRFYAQLGRDVEGRIRSGTETLKLLYGGSGNA